MNSMSSLFEYISHSSLVSLGETKLTTIIEWIFHVSHFLRLFMISFKDGLILIRYSKIDSVLLKITHSYWFVLLLVEKGF